MWNVAGPVGQEFVGVPVADRVVVELGDSVETEEAKEDVRVLEVEKVEVVLFGDDMLDLRWYWLDMRDWGSSIAIHPNRSKVVMTSVVSDVFKPLSEVKYLAVKNLISLLKAGKC